MIDKIKNIGVVGAGAMGSAIAQVFAQNGYHVILRDIKDEYLESGIAGITKFMNRSIEREKLTEDEKNNILGRITTTTDLKDFAEVDFVVEAIIEKMDIKQKTFKEIEGIVREDVILATNTSSLSITEIGSVLEEPSRFGGMHFFNPPQIMKLVEVIHGLESSYETMETIVKLAEDINKEVVVVKKDVPGFVVNRILTVQMREAIRLLEEGIASAEDIDKAMKYGLNHPMGAFELQDFTGVDIGFYIMEYFEKEFGEDRWAPPILLKNMMRAGRTGRKAGKGFYDYENK